jgi:hypothetical protein
MILPKILKFQDRIIHCSSIVKDVFDVSPDEILNAYIMRTERHRALFVTNEDLHPHLYFLRTTISNYQGVTSVAMEILSSLGIDVRAYDDVTLGNVAFWNVCLNLPKELDSSEGHRFIVEKLREKCGIIPPVEFSLVEVFPYFGDLGKQEYKIKINKNLDAPIDGDIASKLSLDWKPTIPSAVIATPIDLVPGIILYFAPPDTTLFMCEVIMKDKLGAMSEISKLVAKHVDLLASSGRTIKFREHAQWKFYGIVTGNLDGLEGDLKKAKNLGKINLFERVDINKLT